MGNDEHRYKVIITRQGKDDIVLYNLHAGDHEVNLGSYDKEGEYEFSIVARDEYGRYSHELFNFIKVKAEKENKVYYVTEQDLKDYEIAYNVDREIKLMVDCSKLATIDDTTVANEVLRVYNNTKVPSGKYICFIEDRFGDGVFLGKTKGYKRNKVKFADNYNKEAIELECNNTRKQLQQLLFDKVAEGYDKVVMYKAVYTINANVSTSEVDNIKDQGIRVPSGLDLDLNGATIKLNPCTGDSTIMMHITDAEDTHVHNGIIEGDYFSHDYANSPNNSEWVCGIDIGGACKYCSVYDVTVKDISGYGVTNGLTRRGDLGYTESYPNGTGAFTIGIDIDQTTGEEIECPYRSTSVMNTIWRDSVQRKYISCSIYLGYQGNPCGTWNIILHFYDKDKNYIKSVNSYQYRRLRVPDNALYVRTTILNSIAPTNLSYQYFRVPTHCEFRNLKIDNCRCVGMAQAQMKDFLVIDCEFTGSGQTSANCAYDAEDGWDGMQDCFFKNLNFHDNPANNFLTCAGHNFVIEDSPNINSTYLYGKTRGVVIRRCGGNIKLANDGTVRSYQPRVYDCDATGISIGGSMARNCSITTTNGGAINAYLMDCNIEGTVGATTVAENCNFRIDWSGYLSESCIINSTIEPIKEDGSYNMSFNNKNGSYYFENVHFKGKSSLVNHNNFLAGDFHDCTFDSTYIQLAVNSEGIVSETNHINFVNCTINTRNGNLCEYKPHAYSVGLNIADFDGCEFNFSNDTTIIAYAYAQPSTGSRLSFKNCTFNNWHDNLYLFNCYGNLDSRGDIDLTIEFENCTGIREDLLLKQANVNNHVKIIIK